MRRFVGGAIALGLCACTLLTNLDALTGGAEPPLEGGTDGGADALRSDASLGDAGAGNGDAEAGCKGIHGPTPVLVGSYCVDATEVTGVQYTEFLAAKAGDTTGQPADCSWNTSYEPSISHKGDLPVFGANWCDAVAFCAWAGKRLCGKIGGGPLPPAVVNNAFADEWYRACSHDGANKFPYGNTRDPNACNGNDRDGGPAVSNVKSLPACEGGYPGLFDMAGNLWEWVDDCEDGGATAKCLIRGSSYAALNTTSCTDTNATARNLGGENDITIRCCSDLE